MKAVFCLFVAVLWCGGAHSLPARSQVTHHNYDMYMGEANHVSNRVKRAGSVCSRVCDQVVCGANERVYCNYCHAQCLGINVVKNTTCPHWWDLSVDDCANCPLEYVPICACDRTYYNPCVAECMDIWEYTDGVCM